MISVLPLRRRALFKKWHFLNNLFFARRLFFVAGAVLGGHRLFGAFFPKILSERFRHFRCSRLSAVHISKSEMKFSTLGRVRATILRCSAVVLRGRGGIWRPSTFRHDFEPLNLRISEPLKLWITELANLRTSEYTKNF